MVALVVDQPVSWLLSEATATRGITLHDSGAGQELRNKMEDVDIFILKADIIGFPMLSPSFCYVHSFTTVTWITMVIGDTTRLLH